MQKCESRTKRVMSAIIAGMMALQVVAPTISYADDTVAYYEFLALKPGTYKVEYEETDRTAADKKVLPKEYDYFGYTYLFRVLCNEDLEG